MKTRILLTFFSTLFLLSTSFGVVKTSVASGNWGTPATWSPAGVPLLTDDVIIMSGHTVTLAASPTFMGTILINSGGILHINATFTTGLPKLIAINAGGKITGEGNCSAGTQASPPRGITVSGHLITKGTVSSTGGLTVNSGGIVDSAAVINISDGGVDVTGTIAANAYFTVGANDDLVINSGGVVDVDSIFISTTGSDLFMYGGSLTTAKALRINDGRLDVAAGTVNIGTLLSITKTTAGIASNNAATTCNVGGDLVLSAVAGLDNNADVSVGGDVEIPSGTTLTNFASKTLTVGGDLNVLLGGTLNNNGVLNITGNIENASINNTIAGTAICADVNNSKTLTVTGNLTCTNLNNTSTGKVTTSGTITTTNLSNHGDLDGAAGSIDIAQNSSNYIDGAIDGTIDICDATLAQAGYYLDLDTGSVDFLTVKFCGATIVEGTNIAEQETILASVYPNPTNGLLFVTLKGNGIAQLEVMDLIGNRLVDSQISKSSSVDLSGFGNGIYLVRVSSGTEVATRKIVKN